MNENWSEIVEVLLPYFSSDIKESCYQQKIEECFRYLGWRTSNHLMQSQYALPIGNSNTIRPDIVLFKPDIKTPVLPIEIKRPDNVQCERQITQLKTYVRQLNLKVGLYVGDKIQLYYNSDNGDFTDVFTAEIRKEDANGPVLCNLLSFHDFDLYKLEDFCKSKYQQIQARNNLHRRVSEFFSENNAVQNTLALLKDKFIAEGFDAIAVDDELTHLNMVIKYRADNNGAHSEPYNMNVQYQTRQPKSGRDDTRFSFNGSIFYGKGRFVLELIRYYVKEHPYITYDELRKQFPDDLHSKSLGVIRLETDVRKEIVNYPDKKKRYFLKYDEIIVLSDGTRVVVNNQWGTKFPNFLKIAKTLYDVKSNVPYKYDI